MEKKILIAGRWKDTGKTLDVINPYSKEKVGHTYLASDMDIEDAIAAAARSFEIIKSYPSYKRAAIIKGVIKGIEERAEELARTITLESGKPIRDSQTEVKRTLNTFQIALEEAKRIGGELIPLDIMEGSEKRIGIVKRFPIGTVLAITPFNFPLNLAAHKVAPALACGNPVILKPSPKTPFTALILGEIILNAGFHKEGLSVFPCDNDLTEKMAEDERIKKLSFTGGAEVGWALKRKAGRKKVTLELGGNAGVIVDEDSDIDFAVKRCAVGAFSYAGQVCISVQRIYVHKNIFGIFKEKYLKEVSGLKLGDPLDESTDIGPMISEEAVKKTEEWVKEAVKEGAKVLTGGKRKDAFFLPTVLTDTKPLMKVCSEEVFAPVVVLETFDDFDGALIGLNNSRYGLQAGVFTRDIKKAFRAYEMLDVGGVIVNDIPTFRADNMPYGGVKMSGFGREGVRYAIEEMTEMKLLVICG